MAMARNSMQRSSLLLFRTFSRNNKPSNSSSSFFQDFSIKTLITNPQISFLIHPIPSQMKLSSSFASTCVPLVSGLYFSPYRSLTSSSSSSSNFLVIKTEEEFNSSLTRVNDDSLPAIFYFTAAWCGPCKLMSPIIEDLSKKYPHVTTYKIDVDQKELQSKLGDLNITSVPTLHFFQNGKKADEVVGADVARLKQTVERLYNN